MEVIVLSNDPELIQALEGYEQNLTGTHEEANSVLQIKESTHILGVVESWFTIVALLGVPTIPVAIVAGVLANWISSGFKNKSSITSDVHITFRNGPKEVEIKIKAADMPTLQALFEATLKQCQ